MTNMTVANNIRDQIRAADIRALFAWGAKSFVGTDNSLRFKTSGLVKWKGLVTITLNGRDLYDVEFGKIRGVDYKVTKTVEDVFVEDLVKIIDAQVG